MSRQELGKRCGGPNAQSAIVMNSPSPRGRPRSNLLDAVACGGRLRRLPAGHERHQEERRRHEH